MSVLSDFVLDFYRLNGALVESSGYGLYDVLLPDALAAQLSLPAFQRLTFGEPDQLAEDVSYLSQGHPWVERLVQWARQTPAPAQAYIHNVRLEKQGLADAARQALSFPNARLVEAQGATQARALCHYIYFSFKVALTTDEKHEQLIAVLLDAQNGWRVDPGPILGAATLDATPLPGHLPPAAPRWTDAASPLSPDVLFRLLQRAEQGVLAEMADVLGGVRRRSARYLELDRARLELYYDSLAQDLERRLKRASSTGVGDERRVALQDKLSAVQAERERKLADAEARYRLRIDLDLITAEVIVQPKLILPMQIENRGTSVQRAIVWDPLLHQVEPLACDVCGQPGRSLHLCSGGHLAHEHCLLEKQCADCKRIYCRLCQSQMDTCIVCGRSICLKSLNRCNVCGRGTCREHAGLCHAADGAPAMLTPTPGASSAAQEPARKPQAGAPPPLPKPRPDKPRAASRPEPKRHPKPQPKAPPARVVVQMATHTPEVVAFVLTTTKRGPAVRTWQLTPEGIAVHCDCEKGALCQANNLLLKPAVASGMDALLQDAIGRLCQEYHVPAHRVSYVTLAPTGTIDEPGLILPRHWKDEGFLALAQTGWQAAYDRQFPVDVRSGRPQPPSLTPAERAEADRLTQAAAGLLALEGVLKRQELHARLCAQMRPGPWCTLDALMALLGEDRRFKVPWSDLVASQHVGNVQAIARRKARYDLPALDVDVDALLAAGAVDLPLSAEEALLEAELRRVFPRVSLREVQQMMRNAESVDALADKLARTYPLLKAHKPALAAILAKLWFRTTRWELRGRTPDQ